MTWLRVFNPLNQCFLFLTTKQAQGLQVALASAGDIRDAGSIPGSGRSPGGGHGSPLEYSCLENPHGQRSLAGYSPWGCSQT